MELGLTDKVVLVTGGSKGIGLACAAAFLAEGCRVAIAARSAENLARAAAQLQEQARQQPTRHKDFAPEQAIYTIVADLALANDATAMAAAVEQRLGPIDILVNSAGAAQRHAVDELTPEKWRAAMDAKYFTYIHALHAVAPGMAARGQGVIVNIVGNGGKLAQTLHLAGGAANSALMLATVGLAKAYGPQGVRINAINPGQTLTERVADNLKLKAQATGRTEAEVLAADQAALPLRRYGRPEEVANVAVFLASDKASYVTGAIIPMDGGENPVI